MSRTMFATCFAWVAFGSLVIPARAQFADLARRVPNSANSVVVFNVDKILASPLAVSMDWRNRQKAAFESGMSFLPPSASKMVLASQMDYDFLRPIWQVAVLEMPNAPDMATIAERHNGHLDTIGGLSCVALPDDAYVVGFGQNIIAAMAPGHRQTVSQWVKDVQSGNAGQLRPYLNEAINFSVEAGTDIIMALDLTDVTTPGEIEQKLTASKVLKDYPQIDIKTLANGLASIRGVTLGIRIGEKPFGKIKVDFAQDVNIPKPLGKAMLLYALEKRSAMLEDLLDWEPQSSAKQISIEGYLSASSMRKIFSVIEPPTKAMIDTDTKSASAPKAQTQEETVAYSSQQYFQSVNKLLDDLRIGKRGEASSVGQIGVWYENYARKVDRLPILNVDPSMQEYGSYISRQLRNCSMSIKGIGAETRVGEVNAVNSLTGPTAYAGGGYAGPYGGYRYGWGSYTGYALYGAGNAVQQSLRDQQAARTQVATQARVSGFASVNQIWDQIDDAKSYMRKQMTDKYKIEF